MCGAYVSACVWFSQRTITNVRLRDSNLFMSMSSFETSNCIIPNKVSALAQNSGQFHAWLEWNPSLLSCVCTFDSCCLCFKILLERGPYLTNPYSLLLPLRPAKAPGHFTVNLLMVLLLSCLSRLILVSVLTPQFLWRKLLPPLLLSRLSDLEPARHECNHYYYHVQSNIIAFSPMTLWVALPLQLYILFPSFISKYNKSKHIINLVVRFLWVCTLYCWMNIMDVHRICSTDDTILYKGTQSM